MGDSLPWMRSENIVIDSLLCFSASRVLRSKATEHYSPSLASAILRSSGSSLTRSAVLEVVVVLDVENYIHHHNDEFEQSSCFELLELNELELKSQEDSV